MNGVRPKRPPVRLEPPLYEQLRNQVLSRDGWRCQDCGTMSNLEVHHKEFRSQSGDDSEQNLITLCTTCHASVHQNRAVQGSARLLSVQGERHGSEKSGHPQG